VLLSLSLHIYIAIMSSAGGGWLQAKKRGRDDEQIALDSKAALEQRKQRHRSSGGGVGKNVKKQPPVVAAKAIAQKKKKHSQKRRKRGGLLSDDDSDDDDDSIDDFVVDDEEEIVDDSSEEEELVIEKPKSTASRRKAHSKAYDDDDDDDSDDELTEVGEASARKRRLAVAAVTSARTILHTESSDEDSSNGIFSMNAFPKRTSKPPPPRQQPKPNQAKLKKLSNSKPSKVRNPIAIPAAIDTKSTRSMSIDDNSFASESELFIDKKPAAVAVSRQEASLDGDLEDTPVVPSAIRKKPTKNKHVVKKEKSFKSSASSSKFRKVITEDDYCSDVDEAVAMACAMEESTKMAKVSASSSPVDSGEDVVELLDDDENDGNEQDDYVEDDANARAASSILATANTLSAQVLNTLAGWSKTATDGMIVDGALALSSMAHGNESSGPTGHTWISNETMREILPTVELSEYQLIGVNWLALLHGMKVEMEGTRQHTNVNGILADGT
jgi:hypothetical protein